ncbi:MAG: GyrI-like domain-containing protein [Candidatus Cloacimonetes bacterium]|nr:GyrI-like domain-containing protein [Candidatus Cloacimonadota bacterium]MDD4223988.1 GyrI-like domain-containing protein [Candidatus Cloacimonadota bacterium]
MEPRMVSREAFTVVGLKCRSSIQNNVIPQLWDDFNKVCASIPHTVTDLTTYGVCFYGDGDDPAGDVFSYLAGVEVANADDIPAGMEAISIPAGDYAVFEHRGPLDKLPGTYQKIMAQWLPGSAYERVGTLDFELYDWRFRWGQPDSLLEIWIPVREK